MPRLSRVHTTPESPRFRPSRRGSHRAGSLTAGLEYGVASRPIEDPAMKSPRIRLAMSILLTVASPAALPARLLAEEPSRPAIDASRGQKGAPVISPPLSDRGGGIKAL